MATKKNLILAKQGDEGKVVLEYQKLLQKAGSKIQLNGKFTIGMATAIKCFQKKNKLLVNGYLDTRTAEKLEALAKAKPAKKPVKKTAKPAEK